MNPIVCSLNYYPSIAFVALSIFFLYNSIVGDGGFVCQGYVNFTNFHSPMPKHSVLLSS